MTFWEFLDRSPFLAVILALAIAWGLALIIETTGIAIRNARLRPGPKSEEKDNDNDE